MKAKDTSELKHNKIRNLLRGTNEKVYLSSGLTKMIFLKIQAMRQLPNKLYIDPRF